MITEQDLNAAIAECQGVREPNANTCKNLAAYLIIRNALYPHNTADTSPAYSYAPAPVQAVEIHDTVTYSGDSEFARMVQGKDAGQMWAIIDELMTSIAVIYPPLYKAVLRKIEE